MRPPTPSLPMPERMTLTTRGPEAAAAERNSGSTAGRVRCSLGPRSRRIRPASKFAQFGLTVCPATKVKAPLIAECYANFECRLHEGRMIRRYGLFIWEVVKAHVAGSPKRPQTIHYRGDGEFMLSGAWLSRRGLFKSANL